MASSRPAKLLPLTRLLASRPPLPRPLSTLIPQTSCLTRPQLAPNLSSCSLVLRHNSRPFSTNEPNELNEPYDEEASEQAIYKGLLSAQIRVVKGFSLMTSVIGLSCQPILYYHASNGANVGVMAFAGGVMAFFTFATPLLLHAVCKKYVTEMRYNRLEDTYIATTYSLLLRKKEVIGCSIYSYLFVWVKFVRP